MPRGQKPKEPSRKVIYLPNNFTPEEQEKYMDRAAKAFWEAFDQLEAKGLMGKPSKNKSAI